MKLQQILPQGWSNPRIWPSATHIFVAHQSIWATDGPPEWYEKTPGWVPTKYSQPIELIPPDMPQEARGLIWVRPAPVLNECGHDLRKYLADGWDSEGIDEKDNFIFVTYCGDIFAHPKLDPVNERLGYEWVKIAECAPPQAPHSELIWQRSTPTQC